MTESARKVVLFVSHKAARIMRNLCLEAIGELIHEADQEGDKEAVATLSEAYDVLQRDTMHLKPDRHSNVFSGEAEVQMRVLEEIAQHKRERDQAESQPDLNGIVIGAPDDVATHQG